MKKKIYHVCGGEIRNYGDLILVQSQRRLIEKATRHEIEWKTIEIKDPKPIDPSLVDEINKEADLLLIGGGGLIMKGDGFSTRSGWQLNISTKDLNNIKIPIVVYAVGYNSFPNTPNFPDARTIESLQALQDRAFLFSVRNHGSKHQLISFGLNPNKISVIPDPGMFGELDEELFPPLQKLFNEKETLIGLNIAGDRKEQRFSNLKFGDFVWNLDKAIKNSLPEATIVFIPHVAKYDLEIGRILQKSFTNPYCDIAAVHRSMYPESLKHIGQLIRIYKEMDIVLGMRGHSNIISFGQKVPCIPLGDHFKTRFFAQEIKTEPVLNDCENLEKMIQYELKDPERKKERVRLLTNFRKVSKQFNEMVVDLL